VREETVLRKIQREVCPKHGKEKDPGSKKWEPVSAERIETLKSQGLGKHSCCDQCDAEIVESFYRIFPGMRQRAAGARSAAAGKTNGTRRTT